MAWMFAGVENDMSVGMHLHYHFVPPLMPPVPFYPHPAIGIARDKFATKTKVNNKKAARTGTKFKIDAELSLECFRIPHFYRAFYVYKYATGLSAAIALSQRVLNGGKAELNDYLGFLKGGCSKFPLDLLRDAGVDMETPAPVDTALKHFSKLVKELDSLL